MPRAEPAADCWAHPDTEVAPSLIAGRGLRATAPIADGTVVARVGGRLVTTGELPAIFDGSEEYVDSVLVEADLHLVMPPMTSNHFINHSCDPTTWWADEYTLVARRDIAVGEEITADYATSTMDADFVLYCHCETYRCRQVIEGTDWRIPQLQLRYEGHFVPYLQGLIDEDRPRS